MMAPFSSDIGVTAFESSAYGKCSCASKYVDSTNGLRSLPGIPKRPRPLRIVNYWIHINAKNFHVNYCYHKYSKSACKMTTNQRDTEHVLCKLKFN